MFRRTKNPLTKLKMKSIELKILKSVKQGRNNIENGEPIEKEVFKINTVGTGKELSAKTMLKVTKETYKDRNINFRKYVKATMTTMLHHKEFKTLNLEAKTYGIALTLIIAPIELKKKIIVPGNSVNSEKKIQVV